MSRGTVSGNGIVTDGLVLALDAANPRSYVSGSSTWYDLSGKENHGTLVNGTSFDSSSIKALTFDGIDDYVTMNSTSILTIARPTVIVCCTTPTNNLQTVLAKGGYGSYWNYGLTKITTTTFSARNNNADLISSTYDATQSVYNVYALVWNGTAVEYYRNGIYGGSNTTNYSPTTNNSLFLRIGCAWNSTLQTNVEFLNGKISSIQIYNRALSPQEILQNYNATKTRFGL
jgi:hypothetical protein